MRQSVASGHAAARWPMRVWGCVAGPWLAACAALWLAACVAPSLAACDAPRPPPDPQNVLLVVFDTVGAEHVGPRDGPDFTPHLDALAREGVRFRRAFSPAPWTQPSLASLFTSRMPSRHGVVRLFDALPAEATTFAELLRARGYQTAGIVSHDLLSEKYGFDQGFDHYDATAAGGQKAITSARVTDRAIAWLDARDPARPFFLFTHYFDPHYVYNHHPDHDLTSGYRGPLRPALPIWTLRGMRDALTPADVAYLVGLYHEEIAFADAQLGRLLDHLARLGLDRDTLVVMTADHGEEFMRHGWIGHTRTLYDELLHVPLLLRWPGVLAPRVMDEPVSTLDVLPTVLGLLGAAEASDAWEGVSLVGPLRDGAPVDPRELFAEVSFVVRDVDPDRMAEKVAVKTALLRPDLKLIHDVLTDRFELYDRSSDPEELHDLAAAHPARPELERRLRAWERARPEPAEGGPGVSVTDEERERLRALGYLR